MNSSAVETPANSDIYTQELANEQAHVDRCYHRLDDLHAEKQEQLDALRRRGAQGSLQNISERDSFATLYEDRIAQLEAVDERLVFGRLDLNTAEGLSRYIGRLGLSEPDQERLLIDWRAPEAAAFYQATAADPLNVRRRRHLILAGRKVRGIEDDVLDADLLEEGATLHGQGALLAALTAHRTGQMGDIVATIQSEQDAIIRAPLNQALVVQGGPGTGKTAVALHRAAYLLYTHRERLTNSGVLLIGPSTSFLHYIERVLPALGETGVTLRSLNNLLPGVSATGIEPSRRAQYLKGQAWMEDVIHNAVTNRQRRPEGNRSLRVAGFTLQLKPKAVVRAIQHARESGKPHNQARDVFVKIMLRRLLEQYQKAMAKAFPGKVQDDALLMDDLRNSRDVKIALNLCWMPLSAEQLLSDLFSKPDYLKACALFLKKKDRQQLLRDKDAPLTPEDLPLLDLAMDLLGPLPSRNAQAHTNQRERDVENAKRAIDNVTAHLAEFGADGIVRAEDLAALNHDGGPALSTAELDERERQWVYGHVVVDEAQELSPMQWKFLAKRCPVKSFTIVGDIAQASGAAASGSWEVALQPLVDDRFNQAELSVNYRTPEQVMDLAHAWAQYTDLPYTHTTAVREGEYTPERISASESELGNVVVEAVRSRIPEQGLLAVIVPQERKNELTSTMKEAFGDQLGSGAGSMLQNIVVLTATEAKGLEFDVVLLVEPNQIHKESGAGEVFVAITRATTRLDIVSTQQLPEPLR